MRKAEMEAHQANYTKLIARARAARGKGLFREALKASLETWDHIDGMMQYERRYEDREFTTIEGIDLVLEIAPFLLDFKALAQLGPLLKERRRIDKNTSDSMVDKLERAKQILRNAHRMWNHLEQHGSVTQSSLRAALGGDHTHWGTIADSWESMGLVRRTPESGSFLVELSTRLGAIVSAKCSSCAKVVQGPKAMLIEESVCPECKNQSVFVLLAENNPAVTKD